LANSQTAVVPQDVTLSLQPNSQTVAVGETFNVDVMASGVENLGSFEFSLDYDPALLQFNQATLGEFPASTGRNFTPTGPSDENGSVKYGAFSLGADAGPSGEGVLATLTFTALAEGVSPLDFTAAQVTNISGTEQQIAQMTDGQVTIMTTQATATITQIAAGTATVTPTQVAAGTATVTPTQVATSTPTQVAAGTPTVTPTVTPTSDVRYLYLPIVIKN